MKMKMKTLLTCVLVMLIGVLGLSATEIKRPNILIISIDDLNDWVGCLGGHPNAYTPNIDRLALRGTLFANAHCQAPICTPSRASMVLGKYPSTTGMYFLQPSLASFKARKRGDVLMEHFAAAGYHTMGAGKFVHGENEKQYFDEHGGGMGGFGPLPEEKLNHKEGHKLWDWGAYPEDEKEMPDHKVAGWVIERLRAKQEKPFLLVAGFWRPHVPMYAPPKWIKHFPLSSIQLPKRIEGDREDLPEYAKRLTIGLPAPRHEWFLKHKPQWQKAIQGYLASVAFVDSQVGRVLDGLDSSEYAKNTIVVMLSDHGWHLGEKERWAKRSLWEDGIRVPIIISAPGFTKGRISRQPVGLIDIFPTLVDLTGLPEKKDLEGLSLRRLLELPNAEWDRPILSTFCPNNHSLRSTDFHYIRYSDGSEELYDMRTDFHEWHNLAGERKYSAVLADLRRRLPQVNAEPIRSDWRGWEIEAWEAAEKLRH